MVAMSRDRRLAAEYFENFNRPERQWERVGSAECIRAWMDEVQLHEPQRAAVIADS